MDKPLNKNKAMQIFHLLSRNSLQTSTCYGGFTWSSWCHVFLLKLNKWPVRNLTLPLRNSTSKSSSKVSLHVGDEAGRKACSFKLQFHHPKCSSSPLKNDGWKITFLLGHGIFFEGRTVKLPGSNHPKRMMSAYLLPQHLCCYLLLIYYIRHMWR